jgi:hypothetical protein
LGAAAKDAFVEGGSCVPYRSTLDTPLEDRPEAMLFLDFQGNCEEGARGDAFRLAIH